MHPLTPDRGSPLPSDLARPHHYIVPAYVILLISVLVMAIIGNSKAEVSVGQVVIIQEKAELMQRVH